MRLEACALWRTPLDAALAINRTAAASSACVLGASPPPIASRALRTCVRSAEMTCWLRARCFCAWRLRFSADLVLATDFEPRKARRDVKRGSQIASPAEGVNDRSGAAYECAGHDAPAPARAATCGKPSTGCSRCTNE